MLVSGPHAGANRVSASFALSTVNDLSSLVRGVRLEAFQAFGLSWENIFGCNILIQSGSIRDTVRDLVLVPSRLITYSSPVCSVVTAK